MAGEGFSGMGKRFKALESKYNRTTKDVYLSKLPAYLSDRDNADAVYQEINKACPNPVLIIIDTLHRNFGNGDENSAKDFSEFLYIITALVKATGATVLIVHHSGHGSSDRARGSSSIKAAMDFEYKVEKTSDVVTMSCTKAKDFKEPTEISFNLLDQIIPGWLDDVGIPIQSAILESTTYIPPVRKPSFSERDRTILQILANQINNTGQPALNDHINKHPELTGKKRSNLNDWRAGAYVLLDDGNIKQQAIQKAFKRSKDKLIDESKVMVIDDYCYLLD